MRRAAVPRAAEDQEAHRRGASRRHRRLSSRFLNEVDVLMARMRPGIPVVVLAAVALSACGGHNSHSTSSPASATDAAQPASTSAAAGTTAKSAASTSPAASPRPYIAPGIHVKTSSGKSPAVVVLPDIGNSSGAKAEAQKLASLGVGAVVVPTPQSAPTSAAAFKAAVRDAVAAITQLRRQPGVDPNRIGVLGEGVGAHIGAVALGHAPNTVLAAVLADIGGTVVPSRTFAPARWLERARGTHVLLQRDKGARAMTPTELKRLLLAAPPGTLMEQYNDLGAAAQNARDSWLKSILVAG